MLREKGTWEEGRAIYGAHLWDDGFPFSWGANANLVRFSETSKPGLLVGSDTLTSHSKKRNCFNKPQNFINCYLLI